jgi:hypothetical protein
MKEKSAKKMWDKAKKALHDGMITFDEYVELKAIYKKIMIEGVK